VNLQQRVGSGAFRKDLYFRIAGYEIELKPLRERREDVELFIAHFLNAFATELRFRAPALSTEAHQALMEYDYPGNIRELKSILERALIESSGKAIEEHHLHLLNEKASERRVTGTLPAGRSSDELPLNLETAEIELVKRALAKAEGNVSQSRSISGNQSHHDYARILSQSASGR
jgi:DNA-binding NtrC family response regulator